MVKFLPLTQVELYFAMTKFEGDMGYSLIEIKQEEVQDGTDSGGEMVDPQVIAQSSTIGKKVPGNVQKGILPQFTQITKMNDFYECFTTANLRNRMLFKKKQKKDPLLQGNGEIKDEIVLFTFKLYNVSYVWITLIQKETHRVQNQISFLNMPLDKHFDPNISTIQ